MTCNGHHWLYHSEHLKMYLTESEMVSHVSFLISFIRNYIISLILFLILADNNKNNRNGWIKEWAGQEVCMEMNPYGVACTSIRSETQIQERWGKVQKKPKSRLLAPRTFHMWVKRDMSVEFILLQLIH